MYSEEDILDRAFKSYFRIYPDGPQPANSSSVETVGEHRYAVLRNINGVISVYRVKEDGQRFSLRWLSRYPRELNADRRMPPAAKSAVAEQKPLRGMADMWATLEMACSIVSPKEEAEELFKSAQHMAREIDQLLPEGSTSIAGWVDLSVQMIRNLREIGDADLLEMEAQRLSNLSIQCLERTL